MAVETDVNFGARILVGPEVIARNHGAVGHTRNPVRLLRLDGTRWNLRRNPGGQPGPEDPEPDLRRILLTLVRILILIRILVLPVVLRFSRDRNLQDKYKAGD